MCTAAPQSSLRTALLSGPAGAFAAGVLGMGAIGGILSMRDRPPPVQIRPDADKFRLEPRKTYDAAPTPEPKTPESTVTTKLLRRASDAVELLEAVMDKEPTPAQWREIAQVVRQAEAALTRSKSASRPAAAQPVAAKPAAQAATTPLPDTCTVLGRSGAWRVYSEAGSLYAVARSGAPLRLTPEGVGVGSVMLGDSGELLAELDGYSPEPKSLHRITLHQGADGLDGLDGPPATADVVPDTACPAGSAGVVTSWLAAGSPIAAQGAMVRDVESGEHSLYLRTVEPARVGSAAWRATCKRLKLPEPPIDPQGPPLYSEWRKVASWGSGSRVTAAGLVDGAAWVHDATAKIASAFTPEGELVKEIAL